MKYFKQSSFFSLASLLIFSALFFLIKPDSFLIDGKRPGLRMNAVASENPNQFVSKIDSSLIDAMLRKHPSLGKYENDIYNFYIARNYNLAWFINDKLNPQTYILMSRINDAASEGLNPFDYKVLNLKDLVKSYEVSQIFGAAREVLQKDLDIALTATFFLFAHDFYLGKVPHQQYEKILWHINLNRIYLQNVLHTFLRERPGMESFHTLEAIHPEYIKLRAALESYDSIIKNGGWKPLEGVRTLRLGDSSAVVRQLHNRLLIEDGFVYPQSTKQIFDNELQKLIIDYQETHGLEPDGVVGPMTYASLNISAEERRRQIVVNMERWRWLPKISDLKYVKINIPEYKLYAYDNETLAFDMKVIVGKAMTRTPVFNNVFQYIVFAPYWNIPNSIIANEIAPEIIKNWRYVYRNDMEILSGWGNEARRVSISEINWYRVTKENFRYRMRQRPGPKNPLGNIKFMFPNEFSVYLHDTPSGYLFTRSQRSFSHGCIRIEKPVELAKFLFSDQPKWTEERIREEMESRHEKYVNITQKVPVYIVYFTTWVDANGKIQFRDDLYGHDYELELAYFQSKK